MDDALDSSGSVVLLRRLAHELDLDGSALSAASAAQVSVPLPAFLPIDDLAWASVLVAGAALSGAEIRRPQPERVAAAYRSDRHLRIAGAAPDVWSPLSRFWPASGGWVRTHGNYAHHALALRAGLGLSTDASPAAVGAALGRLTPDLAASRISAAGGLCVPVRREHPEADEALRALPLVAVSPAGDAPRRQTAAAPSSPLRGIRVLDFTRVIAGPVATRTLALAGADVLRIDPPHRPEFTWQHLDTGHGKRSALLDVATHAARLESLLAAADVVVLGYRPDGLRRLGLSPDALSRRHPHLVVAQLTAWTGDESRRGFDSLVQADSGVSWIESVDGVTPGALPAQALDHSAGYLLAAGIATALRHRADIGGGWHVSTSLRRVAAELLGMPRHAPAGTLAEVAATQTFTVDGTELTTVLPAVTWPDAPDRFAAPRAWGSDQAEWLPRAD